MLAALSPPPCAAATDLQRKICLVGAPGVGKSSLVRRRTLGTFSHFTQATAEVRVDATTVDVGPGTLTCEVWDLRADEIDRPVDFADLNGMAGYLLVVDAGRRETLRGACIAADRIEAGFGPVPFVLLLNKRDASAGGRVPRPALSTPEGLALGRRALAVVESSAKSGRGVDEAFEALAGRLAAEAAMTETAHAVGGTAFGRWA